MLFRTKKDESYASAAKFMFFSSLFMKAAPDLNPSKRQQIKHQSSTLNFTWTKKEKRAQSSN